MGDYVAITTLTGRNKALCRGNLLWMWVVPVFLALVFLSPPAQAYDFQICKDCHIEVLDEVFRTYQHLPFIQQRCGECHVAKESATSPAKERPIVRANRRKIDWLGESVMADVKHGFVLPEKKAEGALVVEIQGSDGAMSRQEIPVPLLADLVEAADSGQPPVISDVRVLRVERGVFLSATIGWQTDVLANAQVRYGNDELSQTAEPGNRFGRWHEVILSNLKPDRTYRFSVVSRDLFGRSQTSEPLNFATFSPSTAPRPASPVIPRENNPAVAVTSNFQRVGGDFLLELTLEEPAAVFIGAKEEDPKQNPSGEGTGVPGGNIKQHAGLSSRKVASMDACRSCHKNQATATHPVNVYPKPEMIIPPEYPTLPDGRITCSSCHENHGSEYEYLSIKESKRDLCVGCHQDMI